MRPDSGALVDRSNEDVVWPAGTARRATDAFPYGAALDPDLVLRSCRAFAWQIRQTSDNLWNALCAYESHEVFSDEVRRTLDLLDHIDENIGYFRIRIGDVAAFLPRNQPLYALTCFVLIPSLMSTGVHFRVPAAWRNSFRIWRAPLICDPISPTFTPHSIRGRNFCGSVRRNCGTSIPK